MAHRAVFLRTGPGQQRPIGHLRGWAVVLAWLLALGGVASCGGEGASGTVTVPSTTAATSPVVSETTQPATSIQAPPPSVPEGLLSGEWVDVELLGLDVGELPDGFTIAGEGDVSVLTGCEATSRYCRIEQVLDYPADTHLHNRFTGAYRMTMQAVITTDQAVLDTYLEDEFDGESFGTAHAVEGEYDIDMVVYPAAIVRTASAVFMLVSDRMVDGTSCDGADDCDEYFASGRSLDAAERAIVEAYRALFVEHTGPASFEWEWSYSAP